MPKVHLPVFWAPRLKFRPFWNAEPSSTGFVDCLLACTWQRVKCNGGGSDADREMTSLPTAFSSGDGCLPRMARLMCDGRQAAATKPGARDLPGPGRTVFRNASVNAFSMRRRRPRRDCSSRRNSISMGLRDCRSGKMPELERPGAKKPTFRAVRP